MRGTEAVINFHDAGSTQRLLPDRRADAYYSPSLKRKITEKITGYVRLILSDAGSRNIFFFLCLNLSFAFVELFYGIWSNSLGLISDSFHMFFDCTALLAGLVASIITKWRATNKFSYGYVRAETLAGFVNGLFLLFIAFFIFNEAIERFVETPEIHHERLLLVSVAGFIVNLVGIFVFNHGHDPSQGCSHGHSHGPGHSHSHSAPAVSSHNHDHGGSCSHDHGHDHSGHNHFHYGHDHHDHQHDHAGHSHGHSHSHGGDKNAPRSQIMQGVFLHILADALGSVGVIISSILIKTFGWMIADPICSMCIACLIFVSVIPLLKDSICILMQRTPHSLDDVLPECLYKVGSLPGVLSCQEPHFWTLCSNHYVGNIKLEVSTQSDPRYILSAAKNIFLSAGLRDMYIQLEFPNM
ncbi:zinc transporter 7-like [Paramacrobiotus metropolitanus]|uniref:zinc transporter 7-like n=1 Tax=Paramacrobiotus metropolitanus TaxID=2943436 RepID=UPI0024460619|nr:zinc transporter 7-like [Paramacrobiotus metropolitanus]